MLNHILFPDLYKIGTTLKKNAKSINVGKNDIWISICLSWVKYIINKISGKYIFTGTSLSYLNIYKYVHRRPKTNKTNLE